MTCCTHKAGPDRNGGVAPTKSTRGTGGRRMQMQVPDICL